MTLRSKLIVTCTLGLFRGICLSFFWKMNEFVFDRSYFIFGKGDLSYNSLETNLVLISHLDQNIK